MRKLTPAEKLREQLGLGSSTFKSEQNPSHTKKGPGRKHLQGKSNG
ncbi:hypothetical protein UFOVP61_21 [uncultured Caudovirales phage]|uniref:Uncharacterized protein n=1 Tax=uncultured Caudovirales phage TaxID=2100421 RepID=A0A6J5KUK8_9CAUD|nr:hypothetical protein UFOVP61_21 [uncultured Caudovirales phage]